MHFSYQTWTLFLHQFYDLNNIQVKAFILRSVIFSVSYRYTHSYPSPPSHPQGRDEHCRYSPKAVTRTIWSRGPGWLPLLFWKLCHYSNLSHIFEIQYFNRQKIFIAFTFFNWLLCDTKTSHCTPNTNWNISH